MSSNSDIDNLIDLMAKLPGLGPRSARRAVLHLIRKRTLLLTPRYLNNDYLERLEAVAPGLARSKADARGLMQVLPQFAGDLALTLNAKEGVFIAGGIAKRYPDLMETSRFRSGFEAKYSLNHPMDPFNGSFFLPMGR